MQWWYLTLVSYLQNKARKLFTHDIAINLINLHVTVDDGTLGKQQMEGEKDRIENRGQMEEQMEEQIEKGRDR